MSVDLFNVLKAGYDPNNPDSEARLVKDGYVKDKDLSNGNEQTYYNGKTNKLLYNTTGSHNIKDFFTDAYLLAGKIKDTSRYKESEATLKKARDKYKNAETTLTGHSLGGRIASDLGSAKDKVVSLDAGYSPFQPTRSNTTAYRSSGDIVSLFGANAKHMKTIKTKGLGSAYFKGGLIGGILKSHDINNIKGKVFV